jgi:hypothetical protein
LQVVSVFPNLVQQMPQSQGFTGMVRGAFVVNLRLVFVQVKVDAINVRQHYITMLQSRIAVHVRWDVPNVVHLAKLLLLYAPFVIMGIKTFKGYACKLQVA